MKVLRWIPLCLLFVPLSAHASLFTLDTISGGYNYKATANFSYSGSTLTLVLTNTQTSNLVPAGNAQALSGLFWNMAGAATGINAQLTDGTDYFVNGAGGVYAPGAQDSVAKNWVWKSATPSWGGGTNFGVGAAGFGHFDGSTDRFDPTGTNPINGPNYGLLGGNWNIGGSQIPFIVDSVTFTFNVGNSFNLGALSNVVFQYGSDFSEFRGGTEEFPPEAVPEPASIAMAGFAAISAWSARRKLKSKK